MQESHRGGAFPHEASAELCSFPQFQDPDALGLKANQPREASGIQVLFFHFQNQHKLHQFENQVGRALVTAISESDEISIFDQ